MAKIPKFTKSDRVYDFHGATEYLGCTSYELQQAVLAKLINYEMRNGVKVFKESDLKALKNKPTK